MKENKSELDLKEMNQTVGGGSFGETANPVYCIHPSKRSMRRILAVVMVLTVLMLVSDAAAVMNPPYSTEPTSALWNLYDPDLHYWYQQLTEPEKRLFSARYDCIALGRAELWDYPCGRLTLANRERIDYALMMDCPELLYYPLYETADSRRYGRIQAPDEALCAQHAALLPGRLAECVAMLDEIRLQPEWGETDFEKEIAADRFLVRHCMYEPGIDITDTEQIRELDTDLWTAYGALVKGRAVCGGYASAMTLAMRCFGVPCLCTTGYYYSGDGSVFGHEWNIVQIDGEWTHEDVTFNDTDDEAYSEDFFAFTNLTSVEVFRCLSDDTFKAGMDLRNPYSMSDRNNYYVRKGQTLGADWQAEAVRRVQDAHDAGRHAIGFRMLDSAAFEEAVRMIDSEDMSVFAGVGFPVTVDYIREVRVLYISWE